MGQSPADKAREAAKSAVEDAMAQQERLVNELERRSSQYTNKYTRATDKLGSITGTTIKEYVPQATQRFYDTLSSVRSEFQPKLEDFQPNLLSSPSYQGLTGELKGMASDYTQGIGGVAEDVSGRLWRTLDAPQMAFTASSRNPAFENLLNPRYMGLAQQPPTVRSDVDSMKNLYTYNV